MPKSPLLFMPAALERPWKVPTELLRPTPTMEEEEAGGAAARLNDMRETVGRKGRCDDEEGATADDLPELNVNDSSSDCSDTGRNIVG